VKMRLITKSLAELASRWAEPQLAGMCVVLLVAIAVPLGQKQNKIGDGTCLGTLQ